MFTDMVGYSALAQKDEALALELLEEQKRILRPLFPQFGGKEIETAGDAFFVEFASALHAVRCAVEIQTRLHERNLRTAAARHILLRIGLHVGDVVHRRKHVHGDGVNIAARIEPFAPTGGICLSEDLARQIENKIELSLVRLGRGELKNIQLPVGIYRVVMPWERKSSARAERLSFFLKQKKRPVYAGLALGMGIAVAALVLVPFVRGPTESNSIAVLPFKNISGDNEGEYFSDGMTDEVIGQLSKIRALRVTSRTSIMQYKNRQKSVREIGEELHVASVLEGSVRKVGNRVRILAQLINTSNDQHLWTEQYDGVLTHIFAIQTDVAIKIAKALEATISPTEKDRLERKPTENLEAYDLYLKGRYYWNKRLPDKLNRGIQHFKEAIARDSTYALAYAGLADSYTILGNYNLDPPQQTYPEAKAAATKAILLDSTLAEAHASLGFAIMNYDWDWPTAERELRQAMDLNPNYATARSWYAYLLTVMGRFRQATDVRQEALDLDPLSPVINADVGLTLYFARRYDEAIRQFTKTVEMDPTFVVANIPLGGAFVQKGMYREAIAAFQHVTAGMSLAALRHPVPIAALGNAYARAGRKEDALMMVEILDEISAERYVPPYWRAVVAVGLGENDEALAWLEKAFAEHDGSMVMVKVDPAFDGIRFHPRFVSLVKRMGLD